MALTSRLMVARRGITAAASLALAFACVSCASSTAPGGASVNLLGRWHYQGTQTSGATIAYDGTVTVTQQSASKFNGDFDAQASTAQGGVVRVSGIVAGVLVTTTSVDFDLNLGDDVRRHVGKISGDSITGAWANDDLSSLGNFTMVRIQ